jgi:hypothetical protein
VQPEHFILRLGQDPEPILLWKGDMYYPGEGDSPFRLGFGDTTVPLHKVASLCAMQREFWRELGIYQQILEQQKEPQEIALPSPNMPRDPVLNLSDLRYTPSDEISLQFPSTPPEQPSPPPTSPSTGSEWSDITAMLLDLRADVERVRMPDIEPEKKSDKKHTTTDPLSVFFSDVKERFFSHRYVHDFKQETCEDDADPIQAYLDRRAEQWPLIDAVLWGKNHFSLVYTTGGMVVYTPERSFVCTHTGPLSAFAERYAHHVQRVIDGYAEKQKRASSFPPFGKSSYRDLAITITQDKDEYHIAVPIPRHGYDNSGTLYTFPSTTLTMTCERSGEGLRLLRPDVPPNYIHPFVFSRGNICYGGEAGFDYYGLDHHSTLPLTTKTAEAIILNLSVARRNLLQGWNNDPYPVRRFSNLSDYKSTTPETGISYHKCT